MDDLELLGLHHFCNYFHTGDDSLLQNQSIDSHFSGFLGKDTLHEADQTDLLRIGQTFQQAQDMGLGAAHIAAGDEMHDFHNEAPYAS